MDVQQQCLWPKDEEDELKLCSPNGNIQRAGSTEVHMKLYAYLSLWGWVLHETKREVRFVGFVLFCSSEAKALKGKLNTKNLHSTTSRQVELRTQRNTLKGFSTLCCIIFILRWRSLGSSQREEMDIKLLNEMKCNLMKLWPKIP